MADVAAGTPMFRYFHMGIPRQDRLAIAEWYNRMKARPAYQDSAMTSYEELRAV